MPYIGKKPENIIATAIDSTTGDFSGNVTAGGTLAVTGETTLATHLNMGDSDKIKLGASGDLEVYHDGSNSFVDDTGTGSLFLRGESQVIIGNMTGEQAAVFNDDGAVTLNHDNSAKLATTSSGVTVTGTVVADSLDVSGTVDFDGTTNLDVVDIDGAVDMSAGLTVSSGLTTLNGKFLIDGSNNDLMTFRTTGDTASQVLGLQFQNNSEAVTAQIFGTGENSTSGVFRIKGIGSVEIHGGDVAVSGDATNMYKLDATGHHFFNTTTNHNSSELNVDFTSASECGMGINDTNSGNQGPFIAFLTGGTFRGSIVNNNNTAVAYNTTSDYRLKENVSYDFDATARLKQLKPARFNWIADDTNTSQDGFLAHEVSSIVPEAITGTKDEMRTTKNVVLDKNENIIATDITEDEWKTGKDDERYDDNTSWKSTITQKHYQQIDHSKLVPLLVKTIQELEARITALESA